LSLAVAEYGLWYLIDEILKLLLVIFFKHGQGHSYLHFLNLSKGYVYILEDSLIDVFKAD